MNHRPTDPTLDKLFKHAIRGPLGHFSEPEVGAEDLVAGLQKRSPRIFAPRPWAAYSARPNPKAWNTFTCSRTPTPAD